MAGAYQGDGRNAHCDWAERAWLLRFRNMIAKQDLCRNNRGRMPPMHLHFSVFPDVLNTGNFLL